MPEYVYVLTNPAMPDLVKVGRTTNDPHQRVANLSAATGVPLPFELELVIKVADATVYESALHNLLEGSRVNPKREFFAIDVEDLRTVLSECGHDVTGSFVGLQAPPPEGPLSEGAMVAVPEIEPITQADIEAGKLWRKRRPNLNFHDLGIPTGSELECKYPGPDGEPQVAIVMAPKRVQFRGEEVSLSRATQLALDTTNQVAPKPYWTFEGRTLQEISDERTDRAE